jgi:hypothetical protein
VDGNLRTQTVLLFGQRDDCGDSRVVQETLETGETFGNQLPHRSGDLHVPAGYIESHKESFQLPAVSFQLTLLAASAFSSW